MIAALEYVIANYGGSVTLHATTLESDFVAVASPAWYDLEPDKAHQTAPVGYCFDPKQIRLSSFPTLPSNCSVSRYRTQSSLAISIQPWTSLPYRRPRFCPTTSAETGTSARMKAPIQRMTSTCGFVVPKWPLTPSTDVLHFPSSRGRP